MAIIDEVLNEPSFVNVNGCVKNNANECSVSSGSKRSGPCNERSAKA